MKIPFSVYDFFGYLSSGFLLLVATDYAFDTGWILRKEIWPAHAIFWTLLAYVIGHIIASLSSFFFEQKFLRGVLVSPEETLFDDQKRTGLWPTLFPSFYKPFPKETAMRVLKKSRVKGIEKPGQALFLHCWPIVMRQPHALERLGMFLNVYGFSRNVSMVALLSIPILIVGMIMHGRTTFKIWWIFIDLGIFLGMFYRYLKFFKHYIEEVFLTYAEMPEERHVNEKNS